MKLFKRIILGSAAAMLVLLGITVPQYVHFGPDSALAAQADPATYRCLNGQPFAGRTDGWCVDSSYNVYYMVNGSAVLHIDADGDLDLSGSSELTFENDEYLDNSTDDFFCIVGSGGTSDEDICFDVDGTNIIDITSNTGVTDFDLNAIDLVTDQIDFTTTAEFIDSAAGMICLNGSGGTNNEDVCFDMETTANTITLSSNTGVDEIEIDLAEDMTLTATSNLFTFASDTSATFAFTPAVGFTGDITASGGTGALTFDNAASVVIKDNDAAPLDIGSTGLTATMRFVSTDDAEYVLTGGGFATNTTSITDTVTLDASDCGKKHFVTAGIDTKSITLPALSAVPSGCELAFFYVGADGGALVDVSPNSADGIEGSCYTISAGASAVVNFSGTDDADIGLTKASGLTGDTISLVSGNADDWYVTGCKGIWANN